LPIKFKYMRSSNKYKISTKRNLFNTLVSLDLVVIRTSNIEGSKNDNTKLDFIQYKYFIKKRSQRVIIKYIRKFTNKLR